MELRPYQTKLINDIRHSISAGNRAVCAVLGCGGGKSIIAADIANRATLRGNRVLFIVHRKELCQQIENTFRAYGVNMDMCDVSMVQTVSRHIQSIFEYNLIITDEAHHSTAKTYTKIYQRFPNATLIGFTATPTRLNQGGLGDVYQDLITSVSTKWLIDNNYLSPYKYYSVKIADTSRLHTVAGEYKQNEVAELMQDKEIYGDTVKQWERLAKGKKTIVYCASVKAAKETSSEFCSHGYKSISIDGETPSDVRISTINGFRSGSIDVLCNCELFGEGLDVPDCECVVLLRPTKSLALYIQQSMRSMRYKPNKTAIIIDHVGNCYLHGLPDDDRTWSLEPKHKQENLVKIRVCEKCFAAYPPTEKKCPYCGAEATREIQTVDRKTVDVDLVELQHQENVKNTKLSDADLHTWDEIVEFQKLHGYRFAWCLRYALKNRIDFPSKYNYMAYKILR